MGGRLMERIRSAAIRETDGRITEGYCHRDIRDLIHSSNGYERIDWTEGFVTTNGRFVDRKTAAPIALSSDRAEEIADVHLGLSSSDLVHNFPIFNEPLPAEQAESEWEFL